MQYHLTTFIKLQPLLLHSTTSFRTHPDINTARLTFNPQLLL